MNRQICSSDLLEVFQKGIHEVIPAAQIKDLFGNDDPQSDFLRRMVAAAEKELGIQSACGLFFQAGTSAFKHLVRIHGKAIGINNMGFRLQPQRKRLADGLDKLTTLLELWQAAVFSQKRSGVSVEVEIRAVDSPFLPSGKRIWLHFVAGLFQEYLFWAGGGKQYPFEIKNDENGESLIICFQLQPVD